MHIRKPPKDIPPAEFVGWTTVCFQSQEDRDRFLCVAADLPSGDVESEPLAGDSRSASVRWRPGKFLNLNDLAYRHGGKIAVEQTRGRGTRV